MQIRSAEIIEIQLKRVYPTNFRNKKLRTQTLCFTVSTLFHRRIIPCSIAHSVHAGYKIRKKCNRLQNDKGTIKKNTKIMSKV